MEKKEQFVFGLKASECEALRAVLAQSPHVERAVLFGSRAMGTYSAASDVDLALYGESLTLSDQAQLASRIEDLNLPVAVDLLRVSTIDSQTFLTQIRKHGVEFYSRKAKTIGKSAGMASEWKTVSLAEAYDFSSGLSKPNSEFGSGYPFLSFKNVFYNSAVPEQLTELVQSTEQEKIRCSVMRGDVFLTRTSETIDELGMSCVALADFPDATFNGFTKRLRPKTKLIAPEFARYYFRSPVFRAAVNSMSTMSTRASLNNEMLMRLTITFPEYVEQEAIAHVLSTLDDKIELNRKMNETLEAMARALFKSWFVDFDPVRAKAEGRDTGLPASIAALFPDSFEDSELGEIPTGWTVEPIGNFAEAIGGSTPSTKEIGYWEPATQVWATPKDLSALHSPVLLKTERMISESGLAQIGSGLLPAGAVLMSSRAPIGYLAIAEIPVAINQGFIAMRPKKGVSNLFLLYWAECAQEIIKSRANGSTFLEISKSNFRQIEIVRPSAPVMQKFDAIVRPWYEHIVNNERQGAALAGFRDSLLPKLISGEIRLGQMEENGLSSIGI